MTVAWPAGVPQYANINSYSEKPDHNVGSFTPEVGPPMTRRRTSIATTVLTFDASMTFTQFDTLLTYYRDDLLDGSLACTRKHPRDLTGSDQTFKFTDVPSLRAEGPDFGIVSLAMRKLP